MPCRNITNVCTTTTATTTTTTNSNNLVILRSSKRTPNHHHRYRRPLSTEGLTGYTIQPLKSHQSQQSHLLKSSSTPDILETTKINSRSPNTSSSSDPMLLDRSSLSSLANRTGDGSSSRDVYLSVDDLSPTRPRGTYSPRLQSPNLHHRNRQTQSRQDNLLMATPSPLSDHSKSKRFHFNKSHNSSASDLSLSTDDLAFNFMLQSQLKMNSRQSSQSSVDGGDENSQNRIPKKLSFPDYNSEKAQSAWDLSPRKYEQETISVNNGEVVHSESLSVLNRRSFNFEEFFVHAANNSGSSLAQEAINAADVLKEKKWGFEF